jgi:hypothetical protein
MKRDYGQDVGEFAGTRSLTPLASLKEYVKEYAWVVALISNISPFPSIILRASSPLVGLPIHFDRQ